MSLPQSSTASPISSDFLQLQTAAQKGTYTTADWQAYSRYLDSIDQEIAAGNTSEALRLSKLAETLGFEKDVSEALGWTHVDTC
jgi:hypothetical protein